MDNSRKNSALDPKLSALLDELSPVPDRDPEIVSANRARFEIELNAYLNSNYAARGLGDTTPVSMVQMIKEYSKMMAVKYRVGLTIVAIAFVAGLVLFTGAGATVSAAQAALPGDALYSVKTGWEQTQARLNRDSYEQALMYLDFSEVRLNEIEALIAEGRYSDIATAVDEFEFYLQLVIQSLGQLAGNDPQRAAELTIQVSNALSRYAQLLTGMLAEVPASARVDLERALLTSGNVYSLSGREEIEFIGILESITAEVWTVDGQNVKITPWTEIDDTPSVGDEVKVHAYIAGDGTLTAREIEGYIDDDGNSNTNSNDNDDGNSNSNSNDNDDDDGNTNSNDNGNDDGNTNSNDNDDDDGNTNSNHNDDDDDGNTNPNDNDDDEGNTNSNDNDDDDGNTNSNDNDDDDENWNSNDNDDDEDNDDD